MLGLRGGAGAPARELTAGSLQENRLKLLFDENLATRLVREVARSFPGSAHLEQLDLLGASDREIWATAATEGFLLVTKDEDFHRLSVLLGPPPKVIWIRLGNCATAEVARLLRSEADRIHEFVADTETAFLSLGWRSNR